MPQEILSSLLDDAKHLTLLPTLNVKAKRFQDIGEQNLITRHMGPEYAWREKTLSMGYFLICVHKKLYRIRFQEIKIGSLQGFEKIEFFSLFVMRKRLSSGQKWFPRPYFPLIRDMFAFRSGLRFSFLALEVPKPRVRKRSKMTSTSTPQPHEPPKPPRPLKPPKAPKTPKSSKTPKTPKNPTTPKTS